MTTPPPIPQSSPARKREAPVTAAISIFVVVFLLVTIVCTAVTFILPESYASTARIKVDVISLNPGPYFIQTESQVIQSQVVLDKVIEKLNLNVEWGKKYFNGESLKTQESLQILQGRLSVAAVRDTKVISITVYSDDRHEAAVIANAIATAYQDFCLEKQQADAAKAVDPHTIEDAVATIIDAAEPAFSPCKPNKPLNIGLGMVFGAVLGVAGAGLFCFFDGRFRRKGPK